MHSIRYISLGLRRYIVGALIFVWSNMLNRIKNYFTKFEIGLWAVSMAVIVTTFFIWDRVNYLQLCASLIGVTSLIFCAKGNPIGQLLMVVFGCLYGIISYGFRYYGEMITYLGMTVPMAILSLISWLRNPYKGNKEEVKTNVIKFREVILMSLLAIVITVVFYFILRAFNTANLIPSTLSVTTSFVAVYLTFRRSPYFALAYAFNDMVLIILWVLATLKGASYLSVIICFVVFLANDLYGFVSWLKMQKRQNKQ